MVVVDEVGAFDVEVVVIDVVVVDVEVVATVVVSELVEVVASVDVLGVAFPSAEHAAISATAIKQALRTTAGRYRHRRQIASSWGNDPVRHAGASRRFGGRIDAADRVVLG